MTDHKHKWHYQHKKSQKTGEIVVVFRHCSCGVEQLGTIEWSRMRRPLAEMRAAAGKLIKMIDETKHDS